MAEPRTAAVLEKPAKGSGRIRPTPLAVVIRLCQAGIIFAHKMTATVRFN